MKTTLRYEDGVKPDFLGARRPGALRPLSASSGAVPAGVSEGLWKRLHLYSGWPAVVGHPLAQVSRPADLDAHGVLTVLAASDRWARELEALEAILLPKLVQRSGARISRLRVEVVPSEFAAPAGLARTGGKGRSEVDGAPPAAASRDAGPGDTGPGTEADPGRQAAPSRERLENLRDRYLLAAAEAGRRESSPRDRNFRGSEPPGDPAAGS